MHIDGHVYHILQFTKMFRSLLRPSSWHHTRIQKKNTTTLILFSPCIVNNYNFLVPTNAHIILIYIFRLIWLLHVSASRRPQGAHSQVD